MAKKMFISFAMIILCLCCSVCFASENDSNVNLGEEITDSLDKAGDSVRNVADDVMNGVDGHGSNRTNGNTSNTARNRSNYTDNNVLTNGYSAVRTSVDDVATGNMSTTTWIWIILAVAAIIIVAMVWYYATQNNNRD